MSEGANGTGSTSSAASGQTFTQIDIERERAYAQNFKQQAETFASQLKQFEGIDIAALRAKAAKADELANAAAASDPKKLDERLSQVRTEVEQEAAKRFGGKLSEYEKRDAEQQKELKRFRVTNVGLQKAAGIFLSEATQFVERAIEENCEWIDGTIVVKGKDGKPLPSPKDPRQQMTIEEFISDFATKNPFLVNPKGRTGAMGEGTTKAATSTTGSDNLPAGMDTWSREQVVEYFSKNPEARAAFLAKTSF